MLNISKNVDGKKLEYLLEGRLDTTTSPQLQEDLEKSLDSIEELVLNFEKLEYISSAGLRVLLVAQKTMTKQGKMKVTNVNESIMEIFDVTDFSDILTIEKAPGG